MGLEVTETKFDIELFERILILMKKYGAQELRHLHYNITMKYDNSLSGPSLGTPAIGELVSREHAAASLQGLMDKYVATDEEILMDPYHGLDDGGKSK